MRRIIALILALCAFGAPSAAQAWPTNLETYGLNSGVVSGGDSTVEQFNATLYDYHIRGAIDYTAAAFNGGVDAYYGPSINGLAHNGVGLLPILDCSDPAQPDKKCDIDTPAERTNWQAFVKTAVQVINAKYAANGVAKPGVVEIWNEPNCDAAYPTLDDYWNNVYVPAYNGVRQASADTNVVVGGLAFSDANGCNTATNWITAIQQRGYSNIVNAYAIHPYGFSLSGSANQGQDIASEMFQACIVSNRKLLATETGVGTDPDGEAYQRDQTRDARTFGYANTRLRSNWPGVDHTTGDTAYRRSMGLWYPGPSYTAKLAEADWRAWAGAHGRVGALDNTAPACSP